MRHELTSLLERIERARKTLEPMLGSTQVPPRADSELSSALSDLSLAMEEIGIAAEVIQDQNDELMAGRALQDEALATIEVLRRRLQGLMDLCPDGYVVTDSAGVIEKANKAAGLLMGVEPRFLESKPLALYLEPGSRPELAHCIQRLLAGEPVVESRMLVRPRGADRLIPTSLRAGTTQNRGGGPLDLLWRMTSVETAPPEHALECREPVARAGDVLFTLDGAGRVIWTNKAGARSLGAEPEALAGTALDELVAESGRAGVREALIDLLEGSHGSVAFDMPLASGSGRTVVLAARAAVQRLEGRPVRVRVVAGEISSRLEVEETLLERRTMEAIGQLAGGVAHRLNNLLTVILAGIEAGGRAVGDGHPDDQEIRLAHDAALQTAALIRQMLFFARGARHQPRPVELNALVERISPWLRGLAGERLQLSLKLRPLLVQVKADPEQLEEMLSLLVMNARSICPEGGQLTLATELVSLGEQGAGRRRIGPGSYVRLSATDSGPGMDEEARARVFEPFYAWDRGCEPQGLGLAAVNGIVAQHGGFIDVESRPGRGTTFQVHLPCAQEPIVIGTAAGQETPPGRTILLVRADETRLNLAAEALRREGHAVLAARSAVEALLTSDDHRGAIDLIVADAALPGIEGRDLADLVSMSRPGLNVVLLAEQGSRGVRATTPPDPAGTSALPGAVLERDLIDAVRETLARSQEPGIQ